MSDDKTKRGPPDSKEINVNEPYELRDWAKHFGVTEQQIKDAVKAVGVSASAVKKHLGK